MSYSNGTTSILPTYNKSASDGKSTEKPKHIESHSSNELKIYCCDLSRYNTQSQFFICCAGIFGLYLLYGYFQELIFSLDGFKPYGWYLTLVQFGYYTIFGFFEQRIQSADDDKRRIPLSTYCLLAFLTLGTMGLSNSSLAYLNYPTQGKVFHAISQILSYFPDFHSIPSFISSDFQVLQTGASINREYFDSEEKAWSIGFYSRFCYVHWADRIYTGRLKHIAKLQCVWCFHDFVRFAV